MNIIVLCPHCKHYIEIDQVNCGIFRHAMYKNGQPFPPHAPKDICNDALSRGLIYGCGKPFKLVDGVALVCDYI